MLPESLFCLTKCAFQCAHRAFSVLWKRVSFCVILVMCWQSEGYADALKTAYMAADCLPLVSALFSAG